MDIQLQRWRDTLAAMTQEEGWIGLRDGKAKLAHEVLASYDESDAWIGHSFAAVMSATGRALKPDAAYEAESKRDCVLELALVHELAAWQARPRGATSDVVASLTNAVCEAAVSARTGLWPSPDFSGSDRAREFQRYPLLPGIRKIDEKMGTTIAAWLESDPNEQEPTEAWGRAWTAAAALILLNWARVRSFRTARDLAWALWCNVDPSGEPLPQFHALAQIIPSGSGPASGVYMDLATRPAVAFTLGRSREIAVVDAGVLSRLWISMHELDYEANFGNPRYRGRNPRQLYLAVLADCLHEANKDRPMVERDRSPADPRTGGAGGPSALPEEHRQALGHMTAARESLKATRQATRGHHRFVVSHQVPAGGTATSRMLVEATAEWELLVLSSRDFIAAEGKPGARWQPIGSVRLRRELGPDIAWIDILFVARVGNQQIRLPLTMEDEAPGADDAERNLLVLDTGASTPVGAAELRSAFARREAVVGVVIRKGLGAFVCVEVDLNAPRPNDLVL